MVIACPECSTKFRVDPARIPDRGTKVRCARCKHVFLAHKPVEERPVAEPTEPLRPTAEDSRSGVSAEFGQPEEIEKRLSQIDQIEDNLSATTAETDFNYDQFRNLDQTPQDEDSFSFSDESEPEDTATTTEAASADFAFGAAAEKATNQVQEAIASETSAVVSDEDIIKAFSPDVEEEPVAAKTPAKSAKARKSSPLGTVVRFLLLLILGLVILGAALYYINGPEQFQQAMKQLFGQTTVKPARTGQIALKKLEGKFIKNQEVGEMFVIRGEAINKFPEPRASIQVKGVIFDHDGKPLLQKTIFCGNPISDQDLQTLPFSKIEELMSNQFGKSLSNMNVNSNQAIPFIIVFRDLPKNLAEFSVNIASSKPATQ